MVKVGRWFSAVVYVVFPEGTFSYATGIRPFRLGAFQLAAATKLFDVDERVQRDGHSRTIYIRDKRKKSKK